jgi:hypothetical protein
MRSLEAVRRRTRVLAVTFGAALAVSAAVGLLVVTVAADYLLDLSPAARVFLMLLALAGLGAVAVRQVIWPLIARLSLRDIAGRLESTFPQFEDRLSSTVSFVQSPRVDGSDGMKRQVIAQATALAGKVNLNDALSVAPVVKSGLSAMMALGAAVLLAVAVGGPYRHIIASRLLSPFSGTAWPRSVEIGPVDVPARVPVGQRIDLHMKLLKGDKPSMQATVFYQYGNGPVMKELMGRTEDGGFAASLDARAGESANETLKVWLKAGDDQKNLAPVTVVRRLAITAVQAAITPPAYAKLPSTPVDLTQRPATIVQGSKVVLQVQFNKPLAEGNSVSLEPIEAPTTAPSPVVGPMIWRIDNSTSAAAGGWIATATMSPDRSMRFHVRATDADGFSNNALEEYELIVRPDQMPSVQIESPQRNQECTPVAVVPLSVTAQDDFGIDRMELRIDRAAPNVNHWSIPLVAGGDAASGSTWSMLDATGDVRRFRDQYSWDLANMPPQAVAGGPATRPVLQPGDVLDFHVQVLDNYELNGQRHDWVASSHLAITIVSQEDFAKSISDQLHNLASQAADLKTRQDSIRSETDNLRKDTTGKPEFSAADRAVGQRLASEQSAAAAEAKQLAAKLSEILDRMDENHSTATELEQSAKDANTILNNAAENPMKGAAAQIGQARDAKAPQPQSPATQPSAAQTKQAADAREAQLNQAESNQADASDQLAKATDKLGNVGTLGQMIDRIASDLQRQEKLSADTQNLGRNNLGKKPSEMSPQDQKDLATTAKNQSDLSKQTDQDLKEIAKNGQAMKPTDPDTAKSMQDAADAGQQANVPGSMQQASDAASQNQQSTAQSAQRQAELGLQIVLNNLREAQKRQLEELSRKLEGLQKDVAGLIVQQAGHNLDDLRLQGAGALAKMDAKLVADMMADANRTTAQQPPVPELDRLISLQEQTERNTRDVAKTASALPQGADASAKLSRAAEKMQRAVIPLQANSLAEALDPTMLDALASLKDAAKSIDDAAQQAKQSLQNQQKETIRQAFIAIRDRQTVINTATALLDKAPRDADGQLPHGDQVKLNQLPGQQGAVSDDDDKLSAALESLDSIVYVWANRDIVKTMRQVKDALAKPQTGPVTQASQHRVVAQLQAMIDDLAIKPPEQKFDQPRNAGGGGGSGTPPPTPLPSEAELKLLRQLQLAINDNTKQLDADIRQNPAAANDDKGDLLAMGQRQGELRGLLDQLIQKATHGREQLDPEPKDEVKLPEEAPDQQIDEQELEQQLLGGATDQSKGQQDANLVGARMSRSRTRLEGDDPGQVTQKIQDRIVMNLDDLIDQAHQQEQMAQSKPGQGQPGQPQPGDASGQPNNDQANGTPSESNMQGGATPANQSTLPGNKGGTADTSKLIEDRDAEWAQTSPRMRLAVIESATEKPIEKFKAFIDDYYKSLATQSTQR